MVTRSQIESAKSRLNGAAHVVDVLVKDGVVSDADVSRTLAAQAHMDWVDLSTKSIPKDVIDQIRGEDARRYKVEPQSPSGAETAGLRSRRALAPLDTTRSACSDAADILMR